ncbi:MAG: hypothetical protein O2894_03940 [Planctomycetota bacterium]|nr:hypothetical protein [Planctomycetota bacterium]
MGRSRIVVNAALAVAALTAATLFAGCSSTAEPVRFAVVPYARTGGVSGFWQTPRGGKHDSTSPRRPTFSESGVTDAQEYGLDGTVDWGRHRLKLGYAHTVLQGNAVLTEGLTSQGAVFPAGTSISTDSSIDWAQLNYQYRLDVPLGECDCLKLWPGIGYKFAGLHHVVDGSNGASVSRHHGPGMPNVLLDASWRPRNTGPVRFTGSGATTFSIGGEPSRDQVIELLGRAHYDFGRRGSLFLETGYRDTVLRDDQPDQQNHLNLKFGPWIGIGGEVRF